MSEEQIRASADGKERVRVFVPAWGSLPCVEPVAGFQGNEPYGAYSWDSVERRWPAIVEPVTRPTAVHAGASCATPLPSGAEVRTTLDGTQRVVVEGPSEGAGPDTRFQVYGANGHNWPSHAAQDIVCRWPRIVTTHAEHLALRALRETSWEGHYHSEFALRDAILAGLPTIAAARAAVRTALDKHNPRAWGWLDNDLRNELEACACGGCMPGEHPAGHPAHEEPTSAAEEMATALAESLSAMGVPAALQRVEMETLAEARRLFKTSYPERDFADAAADLQEVYVRRALGERGFQPTVTATPEAEMDVITGTEEFSATTSDRATLDALRARLRPFATPEDTSPVDTLDRVLRLLQAAQTERDAALRELGAERLAHLATKRVREDQRDELVELRTDLADVESALVKAVAKAQKRRWCRHENAVSYVLRALGARMVTS